MSNGYLDLGLTYRRRPTARRLDEVFWLEEERVVREDWVVRYKNHLLQLVRQSQRWAPSRSRVVVPENEAGKIQIRYRNHDLLFREVPGLLQRGAREEALPLSPKPKLRIPAADHPGRKNRYPNKKTPIFSAAW